MCQSERKLKVRFEKQLSIYENLDLSKNWILIFELSDYIYSRYIKIDINKKE